jgi:hypothetical protein
VFIHLNFTFILIFHPFQFFIHYIVHPSFHSLLYFIHNYCSSIYTWQNILPRHDFSCHVSTNNLPIFLQCQRNIFKKIHSCSSVHVHLLAFMLPCSPFSTLDHITITLSRV